MWKEKFKIDTIYDFDYALNRLAMDPLNKVDLHNKTVKVPIRVDQDKFVAQVQGMGTTENPIFEFSGEDGDYLQFLLKIRLLDLFRLDINHTKIVEHFIGTNLEALFHRYPGTPIVKDFDLYGSLMKTIIHQQLNMKFAHTLTSRFVKKYGEQYKGVWFYPRPERVADISYEELRELQFSQRKAEYVIDTSKQIADGKLDLVKLKNESNEAIMNRLVNIRGIGKWTAESWLLFGIGRDDLFPKTDIGIQNALKRYFNREKKPKLEEMEEWSEEWAPYRSFATITLWRSIEQLG